MTLEPDEAVTLTQRLVRLDSTNPPGREDHIAAMLAPLLDDAGFRVEVHEHAPGRPTLVATLGDQSPGAPLALTGHIDTVPVGRMPWSSDPFGAEIADGRMYGRGTSDMKAGVAALVCAAVAAAPGARRGRGLTLIICAGEESGCEGSVAVAGTGVLPRAGALVVAEPTANEVVLGHKGALWLRLLARGRAAHGSMPHLGSNAVMSLVRALPLLESVELAAAPHEVLGAPTLNVGRMSGGININSVPDEASADVDIRTVPGIRHADLLAAIGDRMPDDVEVEATVDLPPVVTAAGDPFVASVLELASAVTGRSHPGAPVTYFTDASALTPALGDPPTVIFGPGRPEQAHRTDEYCEVENIRQATELLYELARRWCST